MSQGPAFTRDFVMKRPMVRRCSDSILKVSMVDCRFGWVQMFVNEDLGTNKSIED